MQKLRTLSQPESALAKKFGEGAGFSRWQAVADIMKSRSELPATAGPLYAAAETVEHARLGGLTRANRATMLERQRTPNVRELPGGRHA